MFTVLQPGSKIDQIFLLFSHSLQALFQTTLAVNAPCFCIASSFIYSLILVSGNVFHQAGERRADSRRTGCPFLKDVDCSEWQQFTTCSSNGLPTVQPCSYLIISIPLVFEVVAPWPQVQWEDWKVISCHHVWTIFCTRAAQWMICSFFFFLFFLRSTITAKVWKGF